MKIYVSDKDSDYYITYGNGYEALELNKREPINIISLEQHDKELLNKVKSEMLKSIFNDEYIFGKEKRSLHYALGILDGVVDNLLKERGIE